MKDILIKILVLLLATVFALGSCAVLEKGQLDLYFEIPPEASEAEISFAPEGVLESDSITYDFENSRCMVRLKAAGQGETVMKLHWDRVDDSGFYVQDMEDPLTVLWGNVILDNLTLNFSGWSILALLVELAMLALSGILYYEFRRERRRSGLYSYRRLRLLGLALFFLVLGLLRISYAVTSLLNPDSGTVWSLLVGLFASAQKFMAETAPVVIVFAAVLCISNIVLLAREGFGRNNLFGIGIGAMMIIGALLGTALYRSRIPFAVSNEMQNIYAGIFVYCECHLAATVICALQAAVHTPAYDKDYVIILGCSVRPDGTLYPLVRSRVDRAVAFRAAQLQETGTAPVLVPSGGKGSDEQVAEADAMAAYLRQQGIPENGILVENRSATTRENMQFSTKLIAERTGNTDCHVAFSTSGYHVFRGGILAASLGRNMEGMGSRTKWYYWPNAFIREFIGLLADSWLSQSIMLAAICAVSVVLMRLI